MSSSVYECLVWSLSNGSVTIIANIGSTTVNFIKQIDNTRFATANIDNKIIIYDVNTYLQLAVLNSYGSSANFLQVLKNGILMSSEENGIMTWWNLTSYQMIQNFHYNLVAPTRFRELNDGSFILCGDSNSIYKINLFPNGAIDPIFTWQNLKPESYCLNLITTSSDIIIPTLFQIRIINQTSDEIYFTVTTNNIALTSLEIIEDVTLAWDTFDCPEICLQVSSTTMFSTSNSPSSTTSFTTTPLPSTKCNLFIFFNIRNKIISYL